MLSKKELAVRLSKLVQFDTPKASLEQYSTDSEIAAEVVWHAYLQGDITNKTIADLGCGPGILGIAALFFKPKRVYFVDTDTAALKRLDENLKLLGTSGKFEIIQSDIVNFEKKVDVVFQNPPFGVQRHHADKNFLDKAFDIAQRVYTFHKLSTQKFVESSARDSGFKKVDLLSFSFPLKRSQFYHNKPVHYVQVGCWIFEKAYLGVHDMEN